MNIRREYVLGLSIFVFMILGTAMVVSQSSTATPAPPTPDYAATATQVAAAPHDTVTSADGRVTLLIPQGALPAGVSASQITITLLDPSTVTFPLGNQAPQLAYQFEPDGLQFATPALARIATNLPAGSAPFLFLVSSQGDVSPLRPLAEEVDPQTRKVTVTAEVPHFSDIEVVTSWLDFAINLSVPAGDHAIGDTFPVTATSDLPKTPTIYTNPPAQVVAPGEATPGPVIGIYPWQIEGSWFASSSVSPNLVSNSAPALTEEYGPIGVVEGQYFTCVAPHNGSTIEYYLQISIPQAEYPISAFTLVTSDPFNCVLLATRLDATFVQSEYSTHYVVTASDPDGDPLTYTWSKDNPCGDFTWIKTSNEAIWHHPDSNLPGACPEQDVHPGNITVVVSDGHGAQQTVIYSDGSAEGTLDLTNGD